MFTLDMAALRLAMAPEKIGCVGVLPGHFPDELEFFAGEFFAVFGEGADLTSKPSIKT